MSQLIRNIIPGVDDAWLPLNDREGATSDQGIRRFASHYSTRRALANMSASGSGDAE